MGPDDTTWNMMIKMPMYVFAVPTAPTALSPTVESMIVSTIPACIMNNVSSAIGIYNFINGFINFPSSYPPAATHSQCTQTGNVKKRKVLPVRHLHRTAAVYTPTDALLLFTPFQ